MFGIRQYSLSLLVVLLTLAIQVRALYESQAGTFDWHHSWVGHPREAVKIDEQHIAVYSDKNILASLKTDTGAIEWRQVLDNELNHFSVVGDGILTVSSQPERVQFWNSSNGQLIWEYDLDETMGETFGMTKPITWQSGQVAVAVGENKLVKLSNEGKELWTWTRDDVSEDTIQRFYAVQRGSMTYVVVEPDASNKKPAFTVTALDSLTGQPLHTNKIACDFTFDDISYIGNYVLWTENASVLKWVSIDEPKKNNQIAIKNLAQTLPTAEQFSSGRLSVIGNPDDADAKAFILTSEFETQEDEKVVVYTTSILVNIVDNGKSLEVAHDFGIQLSYGGIDFVKEKVIRSILTSPTELRTTILPDDKSFTVTTNFSLTGAVNYVKLINEEPLRLFVVTEGSSVIMYGQDDAIVWSREEALSSVTSTEFLDLPEQKMWTQMVDELDETADESAAETPVVRYLRRLTRHAIELRSFPQWIVSHFAGMYGPTIDDGNAKDKISALEAQSCLLNASESPEILYRDNFGLRKLLISVTASGKVIAQDTTRNGKIVWSRYFESISFREIHVVRAAAVKLPPVIVAVGATLDDIGGTATAFVRLNGLTGENFVSTIPQASEFFEPQILTNIGVDKIMRLPIEDPEERTHLLAIFEAGSGRVYIYPDTFATHTHFIKEFLPSFYFTYQNEQGDLQGYKVLEGFRGSLKTQLVWKLNLPETEIALTLSQPQSNEKVASLGRALGNRNVLYKYLNPHMFAIITKDITNNSMKVRIMDAVKGSILYENIHDDVDTDTNDVHVIQSENWFVYHFWSNGNQPKGYQAVVLELFEGAYENERVESSNFSSFDNIQPHVRSAAFAFPYPVTSMGVTSTRNGISTKDILFGLPTHQIMSVNKRLLDPRRPVDKPTKEDQEEFLFSYGPIPDEKRLFLTYHLDVVGITNIITSPSLLESTSLVYAYGHDSFFSRATPSKQFDVLSEDFSKSQLLLTIVGLVVAIRVSAPMVRRKRVNALWK